LRVILYVAIVENYGDILERYTCLKPMQLQQLQYSHLPFDPSQVHVQNVCQSSVNVSVYGTTLSALTDSGSSDSFINQAVAEKLKLKMFLWLSHL